MSNLYILDKRGDPKPCKDVLEWGKWFEGSGAERRVAETKLPGGIRVSTVFLGLDHGYGLRQVGVDGHRPLLYETMIFGGDHDQHQERHSTKQEALLGHARAVAIAEGK